MVRTTILALAALWSTQVTAADLGSVYVAPGGVYINSARVYVAPSANDPSYPVPAPYGAPQSSYAPGYAPGYAVPQQTYEGPAYLPPGPSYGLPPVSAYGQARAQALPAQAIPPRPYVKREPAYYARVYDDANVPRPPAAVPHGRSQRCVVPLGYGRYESCD